MTDLEIIAEYLRREKLAMRTPKGAEHQAIIADIAVMAERSTGDVRRLVFDAIFSEPN